MNLGKNLVDLATVPVRVGLAAAETGLDVANGALGLAQRSLNQANSTARGGTGSVAHLLGIDEAVDRANRLARLMDQDQPLGRALTPGGPVDRLPDENGLVERLLAADRPADRLLAEGGLVDKLTARNRPLEQLADVAETLNRLTPGLEALEPTIEALREAVIVLSQVVNPLSNIAGRIP